MEAVSLSWLFLSGAMKGIAVCGNERRAGVLVDTLSRNGEFYRVYAIFEYHKIQALRRSAIVRTPVILSVRGCRVDLASKAGQFEVSAAGRFCFPRLC